MQPELESMSRKDAWMFPVIGSCVLVGLYLVFKYLPEYYVNLAVKCYFFAVGSIALTVTLATAAQHILPSSLYKSLVARSWSIRVPRVLKELLTDAPSQGDKQFWVSVQLTLLDLCCGVLSLACGAAYLNTNLWSLSNLFGVAFCLQGLSLISLGSTINGLIMLWGLFIYDITWVFGSDVMVTVAKKFDAPIKLLFPRDAIRPAMLGLGDIVIPGIFMAMMLRLDRHIAEKQAPNSTRSQSFAKPYFYRYSCDFCTNRFLQLFDFSLFFLGLAV
jgi:minor histocompatibility antigen H13